MDERTETGRSKGQFVADVLNKTICTLITNCSKADGVRNYFDVGVIAYGGSGVSSGFRGSLSGGIIHPISAIGDNPPVFVVHWCAIDGRRPRLARNFGQAVAPVAGDAFKRAKDGFRHAARHRGPNVIIPGLDGFTMTACTGSRQKLFMPKTEALIEREPSTDCSLDHVDPIRRANLGQELA